MKIYVASSWRNPAQPDVVRALRDDGFTVYDFRHPAPGKEGFAWSAIDPAWQSWTAAQFRAALDHPLARDGFKLDMDALKAADAVLMLQRCGVSAALETGYPVGAGKPTVVLLADGAEPELMLKMADVLAVSLSEARDALARVWNRRARAALAGVDNVHAVAARKALDALDGASASPVQQLDTLAPMFDAMEGYERKVYAAAVDALARADDPADGLTLAKEERADLEARVAAGPARIAAATTARNGAYGGVWPRGTRP